MPPSRRTIRHRHHAAPSISRQLHGPRPRRARPRVRIDPPTRVMGFLEAINESARTEAREARRSASRARTRTLSAFELEDLQDARDNKLLARVHNRWYEQETIRRSTVTQRRDDLQIAMYLDAQLEPVRERAAFTEAFTARVRASTGGGKLMLPNYK